MKKVILILLSCLVICSMVACTKEYDSMGVNSESIHSLDSGLNSKENINSQSTFDEKTPLQSDYSQMNNLPNIYKQVLDNKKNFTLHGEKIFIDEYKCPYLQKYLSACDLVEYCIVDMDGDGDVEMLIRGWTQDILVLREENNDVYGYDFSFRSMYNVATDGSFCWNDNAGNTYGVSKLSFANRICQLIELYRVEINQENNETIYFIENEEKTREEFELYITECSSVGQIAWYKLDMYPKKISDKG